MNTVSKMPSSAFPLPAIALAYTYLFRSWRNLSDVMFVNVYTKWVKDALQKNVNYHVRAVCPHVPGISRDYEGGHGTTFDTVDWGFLGAQCFFQQFRHTTREPFVTSVVPKVLLHSWPFSVPSHRAQLSRRKSFFHKTKTSLHIVKRIQHRRRCLNSLSHIFDPDALSYTRITPRLAQTCLVNFHFSRVPVITRHGLANRSWEPHKC